MKVNYADINHCSVLIEIAHRRGEYVPEVSYGTHFFQDLVETDLPPALQPDESGVVFQEGFFANTPNALSDVSPRRR